MKIGTILGRILLIVGIFGLAAPRGGAQISMLGDTTISTFVGDVWVGRAIWDSNINTSPTVKIVGPFGYASSVWTFNSSTLTYGGGGSGPVVAWNDSSVLLNDGLAGPISAYDRSHVVIAGGGASNLVASNNTTVLVTNLRPGSGLSISALDNSAVTVMGGDFGGGGVSGIGNSLITVFYMTGGDVGVGGNATAHIAGGVVEGVSATGNGVLTMAGGEDLYGANVLGAGRFDLRGGIVDGAVTAWDGAEANLTGGSVGGVDLNDNATLELEGTNVGGAVSTGDKSKAFIALGSFIGEGIVAAGHSEVFFSGGDIVGNFITQDASQGTISGGTVGGDVKAEDQSEILISGGTVLGNLIADGGSIVDVRGGQIDGNGPPGWFILSGGTINIYGYGLGDTLLNPDYDNQYSEYRLSGFLLDQTDIDGKLLFVQNGTGASFNLVSAQSVPEQPAVGLIAFGFGMGAISLRHRRRTH